VAKLKQDSASRIVYESAPAAVSMTEHWYDIANLHHFWIERRFEVLQKFAGPILSKATSAAEIGCGNGLLQREIEDTYNIPVTGFELNDGALRSNISQRSPLYCYDIHQRAAKFHSRFDTIFLFDVLEHIEDEDAFLQSVKFHLADSGVLVMNVPAHQSLFSRYDQAAGHVRRYSAAMLTAAAERNGMSVKSYTYWGLPLTPILLLRKALLAFFSDEKKTISLGFDPRGNLRNAALLHFSRCEFIPQHRFGSSLMAVLAKS
jgi:2-polyprenyl-3-methyl-5-hydroxy-6-metoxy-1,4-benzoquinol methylase